MATTRRFALVGLYEDFTHKKPTCEYSTSGYSSPFKENLMELLKGTKIHYIHDPIHTEPCRRVGAIKDKEFNLCLIYNQLANEQMYMVRGEPFVLSLHSVIDAYAEYTMNFPRKNWLNWLISRHASQYEKILYVKSENDKYDKVIRRFFKEWKLKWIEIHSPEDAAKVLHDITSINEVHRVEEKPDSNNPLFSA